MAESGSGSSLRLIPWNRHMEKVDEDVRGDFGGGVVDRLSIFLYCVVWLCNARQYDRGAETQGHL